MQARKQASKLAVRRTYIALLLPGCVGRYIIGVAFPISPSPAQAFCISARQASWVTTIESIKDLRARVGFSFSLPLFSDLSLLQSPGLVLKWSPAA
ncbi:hypothetical protein F4677DRAFT_438862 [Hypoxylon crocopeplum]|nr:hypothetical protein F4677DRAFT_438862 [Hypoxylon crocopeplum]